MLQVYEMWPKTSYKLIHKVRNNKRMELVVEIGMLHGLEIPLQWAW
jgi:hypothetical protein